MDEECKLNDFTKNILTRYAAEGVSWKNPNQRARIIGDCVTYYTGSNRFKCNACGSQSRYHTDTTWRRGRAKYCPVVLNNGERLDLHTLMLVREEYSSDTNPTTGRLPVIRCLLSVLVVVITSLLVIRWM